MKPRSNYMPPEQFQDVLDHIQDLELRKWNVEDIQMIFRVARNCALRMIEATRLKAEDFDLEVREVYLGKTKTQKEDYAAIPEDFIPELREYLSNRGGLLLDPIPTKGTVLLWIQKLGVICDVKAWTTPQSVTGEKTKMHIFRKSIGKDMIYGEYGDKAPLTTVMKHLRHESLDTTSKYLKVGIEEPKDFFKSKYKETKDSTWNA